MTHSTAHDPRAHFIRYVPRRPYASNNPRKGVQPMSKREALECSHVQVQTATMRAALTIDLDHPEAVTIVREMDFPRPHLTMVKPENGHLHAVWQIAEPVAFSERSRHKPRQAYRDLQAQITCLYGADSGFSGFMVKTPFHPQWQTLQHDAPPYSMAELFEAMPAGIPAQARLKRQEAHGEGRNHTLFEIGRLWAYGQVKRARRNGVYQKWEDQVIREFNMLNAFDTPLSVSEVRSIAYSVARWTWEHADSLNGSVIGGEKRSLTKSWERPEITPEERKARMAEGAAHSHAVRRARTYDAITAALGTLAGQGKHHPTHREVAELAGVSVRTVLRFRASGLASQTN